MYIVLNFCGELGLMRRTVSRSRSRFTFLKFLSKASSSVGKLSGWFLRGRKDSGSTK